MSTSEDYLAAKHAFNTHVERHKCKPQQCADRLTLWRHMIDIAGQLGIRTHSGLVH